MCLESHSEIFGLYFRKSCKYYKKSDTIFRISWVLEIVMVQLVFQTANYVLETVSFTVTSWKVVEIPPQLWLTARTIWNCRCLCSSCQTWLNKHLFTDSPEDRSSSSSQTLWSIMNTRSLTKLRNIVVLQEVNNYQNPLNLLKGK